MDITDGESRYSTISLKMQQTTVLLFLVAFFTHKTKAQCNVFERELSLLSRAPRREYLEGGFLRRQLENSSLKLL